METEPKKRLDQVRDTLRLKHYAYSTEKTYVDWIELFIRFHKLRHPREMTVTAFPTNPVRGPMNALFFWLAGGMFDRLLRRHKRRVYADLPDTVVELGSGVGANLRYLAPGSSLIAVEPNPAMHRRLRRAAGRNGVHLDLRPVPAEQTQLPDASV